MSTYDSFRPTDGATGVAGRIGNVFLVASGAQAGRGDTSSIADAAARVGAVCAAAFATLKDWNDARLTRKSLLALTDRELDDIGLRRGDIDRITRFH
ncbi:DUF1127 domain-containing protein [Salipiger mucosus]|uniref:YjiS-like domain-containing protein n=1 Tax=Salipiger mucosus DSM 16094 TaxID=1123237 RepID=S9RC83_9RHOB|nr:hypothetical protein Salmuc_05368 [Salipiger mucosus DSM 16094]